MYTGQIRPLVSGILMMIASFCAPSNANTVIYQATTDFPIIDAGEVPYYKESPTRNALAINAAIADYREKFARAEVIYDGQAGRFDITIVALAELDGAAVYNLLINDTVVGTATNPSVVTDYTPIRHTFEDIDIPAGATIAVESLANSNNTIPEGDAFAFARGRWTALELQSVASAPTPSNYIDLDLNMTSNVQSLRQGDELVLTIRAGNSAHSLVATGPFVRLTMPANGFNFESGTNCVPIDRLVDCALPEIAAGGQASIRIVLAATQVNPAAQLSARVRADQIDAYEVNNTASLSVAVAAGPSPSVTTPVTDTDSETSPETDQNTDQNTTPSATELVSGSLSPLWILWLVAYVMVRPLKLLAASRINRNTVANT